MYEAFYGMKHTPFGKDIPAERLYESKQVQDAKGRLLYDPVQCRYRGSKR